MSKTCAITGKKAGKGYHYSFLRSHFNPTSRRRFQVNLQTITAIIDGRKRRIKVSTKALKTFPQLKTGISSRELSAGRSKLRKALKAARA